VDVSRLTSVCSRRASLTFTADARFAKLGSREIDGLKGSSEFLQVIQAKAARAAVGQSVVRGQGPAGMLKISQDYLADLDLRQFAVRRESLFQRRHDDATQQLLSVFPISGKSWGCARKVLDLFLRDALVNHYLRQYFKLEASEHLLEVPLDTVVARELRREAGRGVLPKWPTLKRLTPEVNQAYQALAARMARETGIARVHLDAELWLRGTGKQMRPQPSERMQSPRQS
jgi:hypothetical protein